jgi:hypothetical protein
VRTPAVRGAHRRGIQRDHMPAIAHRGAEPIGEQFVAGDDHARRGGDVDELAADGTPKGAHYVVPGRDKVPLTDKLDPTDTGVMRLQFRQIR